MIKSEVRQIIIWHVELTFIFLFDDFLSKITILEPLKFLGQKTENSVRQRYPGFSVSLCGIHRAFDIY